MEFERHCKKSMEMFGESGSEYHKWIDNYARYGYHHRQILHNKEGVEIGVQIFGEIARRHLEQHIKDDFKVDKVPTIRQLRNEGRCSYPKPMKIKIVGNYIFITNNKV